LRPVVSRAIPSFAKCFSAEVTVGTLSFNSSPALAIERIGWAWSSRWTPRFPIAGEADGLQQVVVLLPVLLEVEAEIKHRFAQRAFRAEQKGDEQPAQASIAVEKRMNGFKLDVRHDNLLKKF
jgi:hypothetical protein